MARKPESLTNGNEIESDNIPRKGGRFTSKIYSWSNCKYPGMPTSQPTLGQWMKQTWLDLLTKAILGTVALVVYLQPPAAKRSFPVTFADGEVIYPQLAYPLRHEILTTVQAALIAVLSPISIYLFFALRVRNFWDLHNSIMGSFYALLGATVFQIFCKWLIGGLRPHFLAACKPFVPAGTGEGFQLIMSNPDVCTGKQSDINDSLKSFPSGHTSAAFASFIFLSLFLNGKLKLFANDHQSPLWKLVVVYTPILGATLIGGQLTVDNYHNWYDIVAGAVIGTAFAFSAYRMMFASVWDPRCNHVPLTREARTVGEDVV